MLNALFAWTDDLVRSLLASGLSLVSAENNDVIFGGDKRQPEIRLRVVVRRAVAEVLQSLVLI